MADRKGRSVTFRAHDALNLRELRTAIEGEIESSIVVFQDLGASEFLLELEVASDAEKLIEEGFDAGDSHIICHPPHGQCTNVSIMGLRSYIADEEVKETLSTYGDIQGNVIRLKYKTGHELSGLENGNRLVRMFLTKKSIPYSLRIAGEWCRIIHNDQQPVCSECQELGHTRKRCPEVQCRICKEKGHMSYVCEQRNARAEEQPQTQQRSQTPMNETGPETSADVETADVETSDASDAGAASNLGSTDDGSTKDPDDKKQGNDNCTEGMETEHLVQGCKRQLSGDCDSDVKVPSRRAKFRPAPNVSTANQRERNRSTSDSR